MLQLGTRLLRFPVATVSAPVKAVICAISRKIIIKAAAISEQFSMFRAAVISPSSTEGVLPSSSHIESGVSLCVMWMESRSG